MHLVINQPTDRTEQVTGACIDKLYQLTKPDSVTGLPMASAILVGRVQAPAAYEDTVNFLNTWFSSTQDNGSDFQVSVLNNNYYIRFADSEVESVLKTALNKAEGEGITTQEAGNTVANYFPFNKVIEHFDEFRYFKNGRYSFSGCTNLESIDLGNHNSLPDFHGCINLKYFSGINSDEGVLTIPEEITNTTIDGQVYKCYGIHTVVVPNTFISFYARTFAECDNLKKVIISDLNAWLNITFGSGTANPLWNGGDLYLNDTKITTIDFTNKQNINGHAMYGCASLTSITQLSDITSIGQYAFNNCSNLVISDLNLPNLTSLGTYAFSGTKVQTISDLGSVTIIPEGCFNNCKTTSVTIPSSVTSVEKNAFAGCSLTSIDLGNVVTIKEGAFKDNQALVGTLIIPDSVVDIIKECFGGIRITNLEIGTGIENIGEIAFYNNPNLTTVTVKALTPPTLGSVNLPTFKNCANILHIYVPAQSVSAYQSASGWSTYAGIIQAIPTT